MLIVIEGLDGSGKSTQVKRLKEYILASGHPLKYIHFPRFDTPLYGDLLARFLRGDLGSIDSVHPRLVALLFAEDRNAAADEIRDSLARRETVLLDRYVYSNIAFQCAKLPDKGLRDELRDWIIDTEYGFFGIPVPDVNIFLDVPVSFVSEKLGNLRKGHDREYLEGKSDIHEADIEFQKRVRQVYEEQCMLDPDFVRLDCSGADGNILPADKIFSKILDVLSVKIG